MLIDDSGGGIRALDYCAEVAGNPAIKAVFA